MVVKLGLTLREYDRLIMLENIELGDRYYGIR
jgi:hypothetical protein